MERTVTEAETVTKRGLPTSATTGDSALSSLTIALPASINVGDVVVATVATSEGFDTTIATPSGWTFRGSTVDGPDMTTGTNVRIAIYTKTWASGAPTTATFNFNGPRYATGAMAAYKGVNTTKPIKGWDLS